MRNNAARGADSLLFSLPVHLIFSLSRSRCPPRRCRCADENRKSIAHLSWFLDSLKGGQHRVRSSDQMANGYFCRASACALNSLASIRPDSRAFPHRGSVGVGYYRVEAEQGRNKVKGMQIPFFSKTKKKQKNK